MSRPRFEWAMQRMRSTDLQVKQDGFDFLREHADSYVDDLIAAFEAEHTDDGLRCWLLELIAEARSERALPTLAAQLESPVEDLRFWAVRGLEDLDTPEALKALARARDNSWIL